MVPLNKNVNALPVYMVDAVGSEAGVGFTLASNVAIAATSGTTPVTVGGGSYILDAQFTGTSVKLQALGADATTWRDVATLAASGSIGVVLGAGASVRLYNPNGTGLAGVYASLT